MFVSKCKRLSIAVLPIVALAAASTLAGGKWDVRPHPLDYMDRAGIPKNVAAITSVLHDPSKNESLRFNCAMALAQLGDESAIPELIRASSDSVETVRIGAVAALGLFDSSEGVPILAKALESDSSHRVRNAAAISLGEIGGDQAADTLTSAALSDQQSNKTRYYSMHHLDRIGKERHFTQIRALMGSDDSNIKAMATYLASVHSGDVPLGDVVDAALDDNVDQNISYLLIRHIEILSDRSFLKNETEGGVSSGRPSRGEVNSRVAGWWAEASGTVANPD